MPRLQPEQLVDALQNGFLESGASSYLLSPVRQTPRRFAVEIGDERLSVWVYVWTLTHGGGAARPRNEFRIQITGTTPPLGLNPAGRTVILGYDPNLECFAGFSLALHRDFSPNSPSIQININAVRDASTFGWGFSEKGNGEIAVAFRPENLLTYCLNAEEIHAVGADARALGLLERVGRLEEGVEAEIEAPATAAATQRTRLLQEVYRLSRDKAFERKVKNAYDRRCAVTGTQLRLIDGAHILPVQVEGSTDEVSNGLCLSPTYHRAFDAGLIVLRADYTMIVNPEKVRQLTDLNLAAGLQSFQQPLGRRIFLPADRHQWPAVEMINASNTVRRVAHIARLP